MNDSISMLTAKKKVVLHAGCGGYGRSAIHWSFDRRRWDQITLDLNPECKPDVVASITDMRGVDSESVDAVYLSHTLEHVAAHEVPLALAEFLRVLKPDGDALIVVPDLKQACAVIADDRAEQYLYQSPGGPIAAVDMVFGHREGVRLYGDCMVHRTGFTEKTLAAALTAAGFIEVNTWVSGYDLYATAQKEAA